MQAGGRACRQADGHGQLLCAGSRQLAAAPAACTACAAQAQQHAKRQHPPAARLHAILLVNPLLQPHPHAVLCRASGDGGRAKAASEHRSAAANATAAVGPGWQCQRRQPCRTGWASTAARAKCSTQTQGKRTQRKLALRWGLRFAPRAPHACAGRQGTFNSKCSDSRSTARRACLGSRRPAEGCSSR